MSGLLVDKRQLANCVFRQERYIAVKRVLTYRKLLKIYSHLESQYFLMSTHNFRPFKFVIV